MNQIEINDRLHGARLAAGFVHITDAAILLGANESTYRHAETGKRSTGPQILKSAASVFGVSVNYLEEGVPLTNKEELAQRLAAVLSKTDVDEYESDAGYAAVLDRLRAVRTANGHMTTNAAAGAYGWNRTIYWQHETGGRGMTVDRLIAYCLSMGARPEFGLLGESPVLDPDKPTWAEQARVRPEITSDRTP